MVEAESGPVDFDSAGKRTPLDSHPMQLMDDRLVKSRLLRFGDLSVEMSDRKPVNGFFERQGQRRTEHLLTALILFLDQPESAPSKVHLAANLWLLHIAHLHTHQPDFHMTIFISGVRSTSSQILVLDTLRIKINELQYWLMDKIDRCECPRDDLYVLCIVQENWPEYIWRCLTPIRYHQRSSTALPNERHRP